MRHSAVLFAIAALCSACNRSPVRWVDQTEMPERHPSPLAFPGPSPLDSTLRDSTGSAAFSYTQDLLREAGAESMLATVIYGMPEAKAPLPDNAPATPMAMGPVARGNDLGTGNAPVDAARCARSLRIVDAQEHGKVAVWWTRRSGGRVALVAAWRLGPRVSGDTGMRVPPKGGSTLGPVQGGVSVLIDYSEPWRGPIDVDTLDQGAGDANATERGAVGCNRPAPGVAVDSVHGYVHVAYALNAPEGPGVFYAHQMDPRSAFEPPVVIVYGDRRLGVARVAASGNVVAVAYEDPNAPLHRGRIGLAMSRTSGHSFEPRVDASPLGKAVDPYVRVQGSAAVVGWTEVDSTTNATSAFRMRRGVVR